MKTFALSMLWTVMLFARAWAANDAVLRDGFEPPGMPWKSGGGQGAFRVEKLEQSNRAVHSGLVGVAAVVAADNDGPVWLSYELANARVIDELTARVWVKANRPRLQLFLRVVLPRSLGPNGRPWVAELPGTVYTRVGNWQELEVVNVPAALAAHARWLRSAFNAEVDVHEAYVDRVLLNASGGRGPTTLFIDDLAVTGVVSAAPAERPTPFSTTSAPIGNPSTVAPTPRTPIVRLRGPNLSVGGLPFFPRAIQHQGESFEFLRKLGFNTVRLTSPATPKQGQEAARLGLWLICPPEIEQASANDTFTGPPRVLGPQFERVLAWDLGRDLAAAELERTKTQAESIRLRDRELARPLVCSAAADLRAYSRCCEIMLLDQSPIGTSLELPKYLSWLRDRPRLARLNTPVWATVQTEPAPETVEQVARLTSGRIRNFAIQSEQIRLLAYTALAGGARGLLYESRSRLDADDPLARQRAQTLELLNLELGLVESWAATGNYTMTIPGSNPETLAAVLESNYSRILLPMWSGVGAQFVPGQLAGNNASFVVPGVPESSNAYEVTPANLPPPRHKRQAGGTRVTLDEFGLTSIILLTSDALAIQHVSQRLGAINRRAAEIENALLTARLSLVMEVDQRLRAQGKTVARGAEFITLAQTNAAQSEQALQTQDFQTACLAAQRATRPLRMLERAHWEAITNELPTVVSTPLAISFVTLPEEVAFSVGITKTQFVPTELVGGDFEQLQVLGQAGWRHVRYTERFSEPLIRTGAELSTTNPHYGRNCLRFWAQPIDPAQAPELVETPPVWIESPPVIVATGELLKFQGWVRLTGAVTGSQDGLMIFDSVAGRTLAERIVSTDAWRQFTLYRVATKTGPVHITFALTGLGDACIDDVTIERVARPRDVIGTPAQAAQTMLPRPAAMQPPLR